LVEIPEIDRRGGGMLRRITLVVAAMLGGAVLCVPPGQAQISPAALDRATRATVLVRVDRVYQGGQFKASGTGFFISPDGHVLTNWHVVAGQIKMFVYGQQREIPTHVQSIDVVIDSGKLDERVLPATVVARDRQHDLALLQVRFRPKDFLDVNAAGEPKVAERVWVIGFPFGDLLSDTGSNAAQRRNPELTVSSGIVTSLRHDEKGELHAIQTDAAVNPGNSGGPMLDGQGRLVGVVNARISGSEGIGFGIPPTRIRAFARSKAFKTTFRPSVVYDPPDAISVTVKPILAHLAGVTGTVRLEGSDIHPVEAPLVLRGSSWLGTIGKPEKIPGKPLPKSYIVAIRFQDASGRRVAERRYRLESLSLNEQPKLESSRDPGQMMEDRRLFGNSISISDYTKGQGDEAEKNRRLSDVAGNIKLKRSPSGSVVIDDQMLNKLTSPLERIFPDSRYTEIGDPGLRHTAKRYDAARWVVREVDRQMPLIKEYREHPDYRIRYQAKLVEQQFRQYRQQAQAVLPGLTAQLKSAGLVFCSDREKWYFKHAAPCESPQYPGD